MNNIVDSAQNLLNRPSQGSGVVAERYRKGWIEVGVRVLTWNTRKLCSLFYPS